MLGHDVVDDAREIRRRIGYVFGGDRGLYERLSAYDNLRYFAELYGVSGKAQRRRIDEVLELVGLKGRESERVEGFSRGMRQRLHIARGILHDPEVVFLDEPTIGVDPVGARELRQTIADLIAAGKTVLLTTHYMFEADALCDRIAVIAKGRIVGEGTPAQLKDNVTGGRVTEIEVFGVRRLDRRTSARDRGRDVGDRRGSRPGTAARRPDERRTRGDRAAARGARRPRGRAGLLARADARGRVRRRSSPRRDDRGPRLLDGVRPPLQEPLRLSVHDGHGGGVAARLRDARVPDVPRDGRGAVAALRRARRSRDGHLVDDRDERRRGDPAAALVGRARVARRCTDPADPRRSRR